MIVIDGSFGEGGGQILRTSVALSAITTKPVKINNIRFNRPKPGLAAQHLASINAVGMLCGAEISGAEIGSDSIIFKPGELKSGKFHIDIGTAGSMILVLQACLPAALNSPSSTIIELTGGTDVKSAPSCDYFKYVMIPFLKQMGAEINIISIKRGYYPKGGGKLRIEIIPPNGNWNSLELTSQGDLESIKGVIHIANLPEHISERLKKTASSEIVRKFGDIKLELELDIVSGSRSPGVGITLWASTTTTRLGSSKIGERGISAEILAKTAVSDLYSAYNTGSSVDVYTADQLLPYLAFNPGCFLAPEPLSEHTTTNLEVIRQFYSTLFEISSKGNTVEIKSKT